MKNKKIKFLELFSGIGGFRIGLEKSAIKFGYQTKCVGYSEIDKYAIKTYESNFSKSDFNIGDITKIDNKIIDKIQDFDFLFGGFPCQPFSTMGLKKGFKDERGGLFFNIVKLIKRKKPRVFILENVRGLVNHDNGSTLKTILKVLQKDLGYYVRYEIINSSDFGVPQTRRRLFIVGFRNKKDFNKIREIDFIKYKNKTRFKTTWHLLEKQVDQKYYLSDKILKTILSHGSGKFYSKSEINREIARPLTASMHKMHRASQDNYYSEDFINKNFKSKKTKIRRITPKEAFRLQGFSDQFVNNAIKIGVSDSQLYRQAGNAVTVNVVEAIISGILENLD